MADSAATISGQAALPPRCAPARRVVLVRRQAPPGARSIRNPDPIAARDASPRSPRNRHPAPRIRYSAALMPTIVCSRDYTVDKAAIISRMITAQESPESRVMIAMAHRRRILALACRA